MKANKKSPIKRLHVWQNESIKNLLIGQNMTWALKSPSHVTQVHYEGAQHSEKQNTKLHCHQEHSHPAGSPSWSAWPCHPALCLPMESSQRGDGVYEEKREWTNRLMTYLLVYGRLAPLTFCFLSCHSSGTTGCDSAEVGTWQLKRIV